MAKGPSPLLGYNTNVRHKGKLYHIQTEDSGVRHPHIITHLFADGGRIVATKKSTYSEHVGREDMQALVKKMMQEQHKAMFIALRDGVYDEQEAAIPAPAREDDTQRIQHEPAVDVDALERAAQRMSTTGDVRDTGEHRVPPPVPAAAKAPRPTPASLESAKTIPGTLPSPSTLKPRTSRPPKPKSAPPTGPGRYQTTRPAHAFERIRQQPKPTDSIFGSDLLSEKSLDEVILAYLAEDLQEEK